MPVIEYSDILPGSAESLFDLSQDYARRLDWDPFPQGYRFLPPFERAEPSAMLVVRARNGFEMTVRYVSFRRPQVAAIEMIRGPWFIAAFAGSWRFVEVAPERTRVTFKYNIVAGPRWLAWLIQPLLDRSFARHARKRLQALHSHVMHRDERA
jgi:ribosome-associated toxin RatA of RatAB toxin-antitoxin module